MSITYGLIGYQIWTKYLTPPNASLYPGYSFACSSVVLSVTIEMLAEPLFMYSQLKQHLMIRIIAEALALLTRSLCLLIYLLISSYYTINSHQYLLQIFAYGQISASIIYLMVYLVFFYNQRLICLSLVKDDTRVNLFPLWSFKNYFDDIELIRVIISFMLQTVVKQVLTEGEKFIMTFFDTITFAEQGAYDMVNNLSSLAARFILAPLEESSYLMFCMLINRTDKLSEQNYSDLKAAKTFLVNMTKLMMYFGLIVATFGYSYSHLAIIVYAGNKFTGGSSATVINLMKGQTIYMALIALNGVTETFTFASMTQGQLNWFNIFLVALSIILLTFAYFFTLYFGSIGFIIANSFNMTLRVIHSLLFIRTFWRASQVAFNTNEKSIFNQMLPRSMPLLTLAIFFIIMQVTEKLFCCSTVIFSMIHLFIGTFLFICQLMILYRYEYEMIAYIRSNFFSAKKKSTRQTQ